MLRSSQPGPKGTAETENIVFGENEGQEPVEQSAEVEAPEAAPEGNSPQQIETPQSNPFWKEVEEKLGPNNYAVIQPYLAQADTQHRQGIEAVNSRYKPYQPLIDQGLTPEVITQHAQLVKQLNEAPEVIYEKLGEFLQQQGRLPSPQELQDEIDDPDAEEDPRDRQIADLTQQIQQLGGFVTNQYQQQQMQQLNAEADDWLDGEATRLKQTHSFSDDDVKEVYRIAAGQIQQGQSPDLDAAAAHFVGLRDRFRNAPRAAANAPAVPGGAGGGTPGTGTQNPSKMSAAERQALVAQMLSK